MWNEKSEQSNEIKTSTTKSGRTGKKKSRDAKDQRERAKRERSTCLAPVSLSPLVVELRISSFAINRATSASAASVGYRHPEVM